jgi:hypothetical protein
LKFVSVDRWNSRTGEDRKVIFEIFAEKESRYRLLSAVYNNAGSRESANGTLQACVIKRTVMGSIEGKVVMAHYMMVW